MQKNEQMAGQVCPAEPSRSHRFAHRCKRFKQLHCLRDDGPLCVFLERRGNDIAILSYMATPQLTELQRLILQIERDLATQAQLRTLLTAADQVVANNREELRRIKAHIKRTRKRAL